MERLKMENSETNFSLRARLRSFRGALSGIVALLKYEHNARIHLFIFLLVIAAGILFRVTRTDWIAIVFASGFVFVAECFNTSIEYLSDMVFPLFHERIKIVKDITAAGVLISALVAVIIGLMVFLPKIFTLLAG